jgi:site-specific DNA recombinase
MKPGSAKTVRCAIYTRVSTDQGLEQDFNSLDAQYDASQAYSRQDVWVLICRLNDRLVDQRGRVSV